MIIILIITFSFCKLFKKLKVYLPLPDAVAAAVVRSRFAKSLSVLRIIAAVHLHKVFRSPLFAAHKGSSADMYDFVAGFAYRNHVG